MNKRLKKKLHNKRAQARSLKSIRRRNQWLKNKRQRLLGQSSHQREYAQDRSIAYQVNAPQVFCIRKDPDSVFKFIAHLKSLKKKSSIRSVFISMRHCTDISNGVIALMISSIKELKVFNIKVSGNYPVNKATRSILERSGFFNFVTGNVLEENRKTLNTIVQQGTDVVDAALVAPVVLRSMNVVWGKPYKNPRIQSLLVELMANTVNHAFKASQQSKWYLSTSADQVNKTVSFTFIDNGRGIINTLNVKFADKILNLLLNSTDEILSAAFDGKFGSRTKEKKRGRGLPNIKKCFNENYISKLLVITNNVYFDFDTGTSRKLNYDFNGTCYYWEIDLNCTPWKIL